MNVHPAKREVRFRNETAVRGFVIRSVLQRLRELGVAAATASAEGSAAPVQIGRAAISIFAQPTAARPLAAGHTEIHCRSQSDRRFIR